MVTSPLTPSGRENGPVSLPNAVFIGYMVGTYLVIGKGGVQAIANMAGEFVGRWLLAYAKSQGKEIDSLRALAEFFQANELTSAVTIEETTGEVTALGVWIGSMLSAPCASVACTFGVVGSAVGVEGEPHAPIRTTKVSRSTTKRNLYIRINLDEGIR